MTKEELRKEAQEWTKDHHYYNGTMKGYIAERDSAINGYLAGAEPREKRNAELEEKISVLLSCKKCPENKGGFICQKEYENKCLAQKIQYIKELQEENAELRRNEFNARSCLELQQSQDKAILNCMGEQLTKAKEILQEYIRINLLPPIERNFDDEVKLFKQAEQFLQEIKEK